MTPIGDQNPLTLRSMEKMSIATPQHPVVSDIPQKDDLVLQVEDPGIVWLEMILQHLADHLATDSAASIGNATYSGGDHA